MTTPAKLSYCPYCKERIKPDAIKCRYCGSMLQSFNPEAIKTPADSLTFVKSALKGRYEILKLIGKGGMASVYKARQVSLGRNVALKVIHPNLIHDQEFVERFLHEARVCASLSHPNVINIYDFGEVGGIYYMAMELLEGNDLAAMILKSKRLNASKALTFLSPIAHALLYIHNKGLLHRDVKSANIFITTEGRPVLMDFGIAFGFSNKALTMPGTVLGTPQFMSPEQAMGNKATPESDYYGLGIVLYECITGKVPFNDPNPMVVINKILKEDPVAPSGIFKDIPEHISDLTLHLLSKEPSGRIYAINHLQSFVQAKENKKAGHDPVSKYHWQNRTIPKDSKKLVFPQQGAVLKAALMVLVVLLVAVVIAGIILFVGNNSSSFAEKVAEAGSESDNRFQLNPADQQTAVRSIGQTRPQLPLAVQLIEEQMIDFQGYKLMSVSISNRVWRIVNQNNDGGNSNPVRTATFSEVESFLNNLNSIPGNSYRYTLPTLELLISGTRSGVLSPARSEWVSDPPVFNNNLNPGFAKYFINNPGFNYEAGIERSRNPGDIQFRLVRRVTQ